MHRILVVDDEAKIRKNFCELLELKGFKTSEASCGTEAVESFTRSRPSVVLLDISMPDMDGIEVLKRLRQVDLIVPVIMVTAHNDVPTAVSAIKNGAYDFISKPPDFEHLILTINRALEKGALERKVVELDEALHTSLEASLGRSNAMKKIIAQLQRTASSDFTVLIEGETGTGKTYLSNVIHSLSRRKAGPFVKLSIGSLQDSVVESELFGYEKGAFTGADRTKKGYFETADGGTIFIDDLDSASPSVQGKLLSVLEDKQVFRVGSPSPVPLDIRIICATNADLLKCVREGKFREDLFFRISETTLKLPPLRERVDDVPIFAGKFIMEVCAELETPACLLPEESVETLKAHPWPGNLRELKNVIKNAVLQSDGPELRQEFIQFTPSTNCEKDERTRARLTLTPLKEAVTAVEKRLILKALETTKGNKTQAASLLQIDFKTLRSKIAEYGLE